MKILQKLLFISAINSLTIMSMEQPDLILACVAQASSVEQACEQATEFLKKQPNTRKITTERFLLACQQKFHRSMYEVGFTMATPESLEISNELRQEARNLWLSRPKEKYFTRYLFEQKDKVHTIPSILYYIFERSEYAQEAKDPFFDENFISGHMISGHDHHLPYWIDSGLLHNNTRLNDFLIDCLDGQGKEVKLIRLAQIINAGFNLNARLEEPEIRGVAVKKYLHWTILDYAIERKTYFNSLATEYKPNNQHLMQMIRMLIKAGAKSASEL